MKINDVIKTYRIASQLTQGQIAEKMHMTEQTYARWENGKTKMTDEKLELFAKTIGKTVNDLRNATSDDNSIINLLNSDNQIHDNGIFSKLVVNNYYGDSEQFIEIETLKNLLQQKDLLLTEKDQRISDLQQQIQDLKDMIRILKAKGEYIKHAMD